MSLASMENVRYMGMDFVDRSDERTISTRRVMRRRWYQEMSYRVYRLPARGTTLNVTLVLRRQLLAAWTVTVFVGRADDHAACPFTDDFFIALAAVDERTSALPTVVQNVAQRSPCRRRIRDETSSSSFAWAFIGARVPTCRRRP